MSMRWSLFPFLGLTIVLASGCGSGRGGQLMQTQDLLLNYDRLGVSFQCSSRPESVVKASVFPATRHLSNRQAVLGGFGVVPGVGAYGIRLGSSIREARLAGCRGFPPIRSGTKIGGYCRLSGGRRVFLLFSGGQVDLLVVEGPFRTPDGVTQQSSAEDIRRIYGDPDSWYRLGPPRNPAWAMLPLLIMPLLGMLAWLAIRRVRERVQLSTSTYIWMAVFGALSLSLAAVVSNILTALAVGTTVAWPLMPILAITASLSGAPGVLILVTPGDRLRTWLGRIVTLLLMGVMVLVASILVALAWPLGRMGPFALLPLAVTNMMFLVAMFAARIATERQ